jgi:hypothetical protein
MSDRNIWLGLGVLLVPLGIITATAAVSLGTGAYLVYSWFWIMVSLVFSFGGAFAFYFAGKCSPVLSQRKIARSTEISN